MMNREEARQYIIARGKEYLQPDRSKKGFICPICGSGQGKNGTGITTKDGVHFTCWTGCFTNADIIDIIGQEQGLTDYPRKLQAACRAFNITVENTYSRSSAYEDFAPAPEYQKQAKSERITDTQFSIHNNTYTIWQEAKPAEADYTDFFLQANRDIEKTDYHRGLTLETLNRFKVGYVASWTHPKAPNAPASPRLIIPTSKHSYLARDTRAELTDEQKKYSKSKVGKVRIFNSKALQTSTKPIFIVEGELDALSIIDVGGEAVALGTTTKAKSIIELLKTKKPEQPLIISLDNDKAGEKAYRELSEGLRGLNIPFYRLNPAGQYKDANEALQHDREALRQAVEEAEHIQDEAEQTQREAYLNTSTAHYLQSFIDGIADSVNTPFIPTGFKGLDSILEGGLYEGLYIMGAISSLGKTTLALQIVDQIAETGEDVLIFSLEMARSELMSKSISRLTLLDVLQNNGNIQDAKTTRGVTTGSRYKNYSQTEKELIQRAITAYGRYAKNIYIHEGIGDIGVQQVREAVDKHILFTGKKPVVLIDYVQILAPADIRATDKQNTDKAVLELKRLSRDFKIPVIGISSFNRANYSEAVKMDAFKESGSLEYGSDVLMGLQLKGVGGKDFDANEAKQKNPREIELVVLKNRNGATGKKLSYEYYPLFNYFKEV